MTRFRLAILCALFGLSTGKVPLLAATAADYEVKVWETDEGLPNNTVLSMIQARAGHLWIGTGSGLVRFNGLQFHNAIPSLNDRVVHLFEDSRHILWVGTESNGVLMIQDGGFTKATPLAFSGLAQRLRSACEDETGAVWLYFEHGDLWRYDQEKFTRFTAPPEPGGNRMMFRETNGPVWFTTLHGHYAVGPITGGTGNDLPISRTFRVEGRGLDLLVPSRRAGYWRLANVQVRRVVGDQAEYVTNYVWPWEASSACEDLEGNLVLGTRGAGVWIVRTNGTVLSLSTADGLSANTVLSVLVDREGTLWVGTQDGGLNRISRRQGFETLEATRSWIVQSVAEEAEGRLWVGGSYGFGLGHWTGSNLARPRGQLRPEPIQSVFVDRQRRVWVSTAEKVLYQIRDGQAYGVPENQHTVRAIHQDRAGRMWFGTMGGLLRLDQEQWTHFNARDGLSSTNITGIANGVGDEMWFATQGGGINRWQNGKFDPLRESDGAPSDDVAALWMDEANVLWVTTPAGLGRWFNGKWTRFTKRAGLPSDVLGYLLDDGLGHLWIGSDIGLIRVAKQSLNDFANGTAQRFPYRVYDKADGLPTRQCSFGSQPGAWRGRETLWFATTKGVASLNVQRFQPNTNPPPVSIETVRVDEQLRPVRNGPEKLVLQPSNEQVEVGYASLNLKAPERARFRYRLEGFEKDWIEAGNTRVVRYTKLPAGEYRFHVTASNEDGVWNETGASLGILVLPPPPPFWRTWWFLTFAPLALVGAIIGLVHYLSTQKLQRQLAVMRDQEMLEKERARIARDIHDQVGASLTQVALLGELVETDKDSPEEVQGHAQQICQTARETTRALDEIVWTVNPQNDTLEGLVNYICKNAQDYLAVAGVRYRFDVPSEVPAHPIPPDVRHNVFLASKEAVTNVVRHAKGTSAWIRMKIEPRRFTVEIEDNGRGVADLDVNAPRTRHGLKNMRKRMEDVGGTFSIGPGSEGGALVRLTVPLVPREIAKP